VFDSCTMCSVAELAGSMNNEDIDDAVGGGVVGNGLRGFTTADLRR
jgi:hypothetical protein